MSYLEFLRPLINEQANSLAVQRKAIVRLETLTGAEFIGRGQNLV